MRPCENPIYITNPTRRYMAGATKTRIAVPCCKCAACLANEREEWLVRAMAQYKTTVEDGHGRCLFITLTYADKSLPIYSFDTHRLRHGIQSMKGNCIKCFDKHDIDKYRKTLQDQLRRKYGVTGVKYLICSEYGDHTKRPHYHGLIYVPYAPNLSDEDLSKLCLDLWTYGIAFYSDKGPFIHDFAAIEYTSKYISKDLTFYQQEGCQMYINNRQNKLRITPYLPRHYQTKNLGEDLAKWLLHREDMLDVFKDGVSSNYFGIAVDKYYQLPRYVQNKLLYKVENGVRVPSELGRKIKLQLFDVRLQQSDKSLSKFFSYKSLRNKLNSDDAYKVIPLYKQPNYSNTYSGLQQYMLDLLDGRSITELSLYKKVFQYRTLYNEFTIDDLAEFNDIDIQGLTTFAHMVYDDEFSDKDYLIFDSPCKDDPTFRYQTTYSDFQRFHDFDELLDSIALIQGLKSKRNTAYEDKQNEVINRLKNEC